MLLMLFILREKIENVSSFIYLGTIAYSDAKGINELSTELERLVLHSVIFATGIVIFVMFC